MADVKPLIKKTEWITDKDGNKFDASLIFQGEISYAKDVNLDYKGFARKTSTEAQNMQIIPNNPSDPTEGFKLKTFEQVKDALNAGELAYDDASLMVKGRTGNTLLVREHTVDANFNDKKFYLDHDVKRVSESGKELSIPAKDLLSWKASQKIALRKKFFETYGAALGTINAGMVGTSWEAKYKKTGASDKFTAVAAADLAAVITASQTGKRLIDVGTSFATDEKLGEAIYEFLFETSGYLDKIGSDVEAEFPTIEDGIRQTGQGIVMSRAAAKAFKKYLANASVNTEIVVEQGLITGIILDQVQIPVIINTRAVTAGGKEVLVTLHPTGEHAPVSEFSIGEDFTEVLPAGERLYTSKDAVMNYKSALYGTSATEPELMFGLVR